MKKKYEGNTQIFFVESFTFEHYYTIRISICYYDDDDDDE